MRKLLIRVGIAAFIVVGAMLVFWPVNFWRLYDANLRPLALTHAENYCVGFGGIQDGFQFDSAIVKTCMDISELDNETPSISQSIHWGCLGVVSGGWGGAVHDCEKIFEARQFWFVQGGGITDNWNDAHPRPQPIDEGVLDGNVPQRSESREGQE